MIDWHDIALKSILFAVFVFTFPEVLIVLGIALFNEEYLRNIISYADDGISILVYHDRRHL